MLSRTRSDRSRNKFQFLVKDFRIFGIAANLDIIDDTAFDHITVHMVDFLSQCFACLFSGLCFGECLIV